MGHVQNVPELPVGEGYRGARCSIFGPVVLVFQGTAGFELQCDRASVRFQWWRSSLRDIAAKPRPKFTPTEGGRWHHDEATSADHFVSGWWAR